MDDIQIVNLYWERSENAISETAKKYGSLCRYIAYNILHNDEDSEECVNDTYFRAWNAMPPKRPEWLGAFLSTITRNLSLDRYRQSNAHKRGAGQTALALDELLECVDAGCSVENALDERMLTQTLNRFLASLKPKARIIFMRRYYYLFSVGDIAKAQGISESNVKMSLMRSRNALKSLLEKEGII